MPAPAARAATVVRLEGGGATRTDKICPARRRGPLRPFHFCNWATLTWYRLAMEPKETRRNLVTRGVPLNHLVGRQFTIGEVLLEGVELCEPCGHLEKLTVPGIRKALTHRGGLRARIITGGKLREGNRIRPHEG